MKEVVVNFYNLLLNIVKGSSRKKWRKGVFFLLTPEMPNVHDTNKKMIGAHFDLLIVARIDKARKDLGEDRSLFLMRSVILRLRELGIEVPTHLEPQKYAPKAKDYSHLLEKEPAPTTVKPKIRSLPKTKPARPNFVERAGIEPTSEDAEEAAPHAG